MYAIKTNTSGLCSGGGTVFARAVDAVRLPLLIEPKHAYGCALENKKTRPPKTFLKLLSYPCIVGWGVIPTLVV